METQVNTELEAKFIEAYKEAIISSEETVNAFTLAKKIDATEQDFYQLFNSPDDLGRKIWAGIGEEVTSRLNESDSFANYSSREKLLTYFFTFFEVAVTSRLFIEVTINRARLQRTYKDQFKTFVGDIVQEGIVADEIKERLTLSNYYPDMLWELHLRLVRFWLTDTSEHFVETDKAIEIYSKVPLEFMGHNLLDSVFETAKFQFEQLKTDKIKLDNLEIKIPESISNFFRGNR
jgi:hypothetical protein